MRLGELDFLGAGATDADVDRPVSVLDDAAHDAGVAVGRPFPGVAEVGVGVNLKDREASVLLGGRPHEAERNRVLPAEGEHPLAVRVQPAGHSRQPVRHRVRRPEGGRDRWMRVDRGVGEVAAEVGVERFDLSAGGEDGVRAAARPRAVGRRRLERNRQDDDARLIIGGRLGRQAEEVRRDEFRFVHGLAAFGLRYSKRSCGPVTKTAAARTVVQRPSLQHSALWVTLRVVTILPLIR